MAAVAVAERVSVLETKVENIDEKIDDIKIDIRDMHDCLDRTRDTVTGQLDEILTEYRNNRTDFYKHVDKLHQEQSLQHAELAGKIDELEKFKSKWSYLLLGFIAALGWAASVDFKAIVQMFGF